MKRKIYAAILPCIIILSCRLSYQPRSVQYSTYHVAGQHLLDTSFVSFLQPYGDSLHSVMQIVLATAKTTLQKKQPEGTLGNFLADALRESAAEIFNTPVDAAFLNPGGIRKSYLKSGTITVGNLYEIMPFDNLVALQEISGRVLQDFLNLTAAKGGWPVAGITMKIKNNKAVDVKIGANPLDSNARYRIVNSDYIVHGGDNCDMLKVIPAKIADYLVRDAFIDYISKQNAQGKSITSRIEDRVSYAQ